MATPLRIQSTTPTSSGADLGDGSECPPGTHGLSVTPDGHPTAPCGPDVIMNNALGCNLATLGLGLGVLGLVAPPGPGEVSPGNAIHGGTFTAAVHDAVSC